MNRLDLVLWQFGVAWGLLEFHLDGLTEESMLWQPHRESWTVRLGPSGWSADWQVPEPEPCPAPTLAWLLWHIGWWWSTTYERSFGSGARCPEREAVRWPGDLRLGRAWLRDLHDQWMQRLEQLQDTDLGGPNRTEWLPADRTLGHVLAWVNVELMKNAAEVGAARRAFETRSR